MKKQLRFIRIEIILPTIIQNKGPVYPGMEFIVGREVSEKAATALIFYKKAVIIEDRIIETPPHNETFESIRDEILRIASDRSII